MKKMNCLLVMSGVLGCLFLSSFAWAETYLKPFSAGLIQGQFDVNYFKSSANFDSGGTNQSLLAGASYQIIQYDVKARYNLIDSLGLKAGALIGQAESNDSFATRSNSTLTHAVAGLDYLLLNTDSLYAFFDFEYRHALETVALDTDSVLNSHGASEVVAQVYGVYDLNWFELIGSGGVNYRLEGLSTLATYSIGAQYGFESFQLGAVVKGFASVVDDSKTSSFERDLVIARVNGGSKKFYSINPNQTDVEIFGLFEAAQSISVKGFVGYTVLGSNTAVGFNVGGSLTWTYDGFASPSNSNIRPIENEVVKPVESPRKFKENTDDGVNQEIFKPVQPSQETFIKPVEDDEMTVTPKKAPVKDNPEYKVKLIKKKKQTKKKKKPISN